jgi:hypothetical protein
MLSEKMDRIPEASREDRAIVINGINKLENEEADASAIRWATNPSVPWSLFEHYSWTWQTSFIRIL